jgi:poly(ADP-ribose) glycohydrolase
MSYQLPTNPAVISKDPLSVLDKEDPSQAEVLSALLETTLVALRSHTSPVNIIPSLIEDLAYTIHGTGSLNTGGLCKFLSEKPISCDVFISLLNAAQKLSVCFPEHCLTTLNESNDVAVFDGDQVNSLLAHQFLGTLFQSTGTDWGHPDFTSWFASEPAHHRAVSGYLETVLGHFSAGGYSHTHVFTFSFHTGAEMPDPSQCNTLPNVQLQVVSEESEPSNNEGPSFVLVAANAQPGPGPTATQEERLQSASPALSISVLVIPLIPDDAVAITSEFPVHAAWKGHNRTARLEKLFTNEQRPRRHYILADALQMDEMPDEDGKLKDLLHGRAKREITKLYAAFSGASKVLSREGDGRKCVVEAGAWGCGAFGGNILFKALCMMIAAGLTGVELQLSLLEDKRVDVQLIRAFLQKQWTTAKLWDVINTSNSYEDIIGRL